MGSDIHCFVEKRNRKNDKWEKITGFISGEYKNADSPFNARNYTEFAILAGVRNYWDIVPISEPRGIPIDVCDEIKSKIKYWEPDGHSHSYLTAKEISDYGKTDLKATDRQFSEWLFEKGLKQLMERSQDGIGDDVRIVFFFDN